MNNIDRRYKLDIAILSFATGMCAMVLAFACYISVFYALAVSGSSQVGIIFPKYKMLLILFSIPLAIVCLVFGINAIKAFKYAKNQGVKPVPTLVFGILGLASLPATVILDMFNLMIYAILSLA